MYAAHRDTAAYFRVTFPSASVPFIFYFLKKKKKSKNLVSTSRLVSRLDPASCAKKPHQPVHMEFIAGPLKKV